MNHTTLQTYVIGRRLALLAMAACLAGCGAGGADDDGGTPPQTLFSIESTPELDGTVSGDNNTTTSDASAEPMIGDGQFVTGAGTFRFISYYSFDLGDIPADATVKSATLSLFNRATVGDPQGMMVLVRVDHVDYGDLFPTTLLGATGLEFNFATINDIGVLGRKELDVTAQVQADLESLRTRSQFRLRGAIASDLDDVADVARLTDGEDQASTGQLPMLIVEIE